MALAHDEQVERQADREAADLDVALLEDVEQADLDPLGEVGQLVDREDAPVGARDEPVVERQLVRQVAALGDLDRVDLADEVGDRDVRRGELLARSAGRAAATRSASRRRSSATIARAAALTGAVGSSLSSPPATIGSHVVEQADEQPRHPGLGLAALAEEDEVLAGEDRVLDRGQDGVLVPDDAREDRRPAASRASRFARISSLTVRGRQPEARSSPRVAGRPGAARRDRWSSEPRQAPGSAVSARRGQRRTSCSGRQSRGPDAPVASVSARRACSRSKSSGVSPTRPRELVADAPGEVLEPVLRLVPGREDRRREPLDVAVDVAGDRPEVVGRRDPAPVVAEDEDQPEARQLVLGRLDRRPAEALEHVLEAVAPDGRQHPVPQRERTDRDPRPLAPGAAGSVVQVGDHHRQAA